MTLTKDEILQADDLRTEKVSVPEWGGDVYVRTMTGEERNAYETSIFNGKEVSLDNIMAKLCIRTIVDDKGKRLFEDSEIAILGAKSAKVLSRIFTKAQKLNGLTAEDLEDMAKNSGIGLGEDSASN